MRLYHGSHTVVERPDVSFNKGFSDLGQGFYLTDDFETAASRARSRARAAGAAEGVVTAFDFDEDAVGWAVWDGQGLSLPPAHARDGAAPLGLRFAADRSGIAAWTSYVKSCRAGKTALPGMGEPAVVRAWIATMETEMVCSGFASEELAEFIDPAGLVVQYCFRDQGALDELLKFSHAESA